MNILFTVGNGMMGDDGAGTLLAQMMQEHPLENWTVMHGGSMPENIMHQIREIHADRVLVVDAADMDLPPGTIRRIAAERLEDPFLMTTHTLPLSFLVESLREIISQVDLIGIQPSVVAFGFPMSDAVRQAVEQIYVALKNDVLLWDACN